MKRDREIVGYSYAASIVCPGCMEAIATEYLAKDDGIAPDDVPEYVEGLLMGNDRATAWEVSPVFVWNESGDSPEHCGSCGDLINVAWTDTAAEYALQAIRDHLDSGGKDGDPETLDIWSRYLSTWDYHSLPPTAVFTLDEYAIHKKKENR